MCVCASAAARCPDTVGCPNRRHRFGAMRRRAHIAMCVGRHDHCHHGDAPSGIGWQDHFCVCVSASADPRCPDCHHGDAPSGIGWQDHFCVCIHASAAATRCPDCQHGDAPSGIGWQVHSCVCIHASAAATRCPDTVGCPNRRHRFGMVRRRAHIAMCVGRHDHCHHGDAPSGIGWQDRCCVCVRASAAATRCPDTVGCTERRHRFGAVRRRAHIAMCVGRNDHCHHGDAPSGIGWQDH